MVPRGASAGPDPVFILDPRDKCGINDYTRSLAGALPGSAVRDFRHFDSAAGGLVHVQFEPTFFREGRRTLFPTFMKSLRGRKVVTVHEVYEVNPFVMPRPAGKGFWNFLRRAKYDFRHRLEGKEEGFAARHYFADAVVVHTRHAKDILMGRRAEEDKINVIPLPVPVTPLPGREEARRRWNPTGSPLALVFGFVGPAQDYETFFRAVPYFKPELRIVFAGGVRRAEDEALDRSLKARAAGSAFGGRITLAGFVPDQELPGLFAAADLCIHLARVKTGSSALVRVLGAGLPAAANGALAQVREINAEVPCVETYTAGDAASLARAVNLLLEEGHHARMRANAAAYAARHTLEKFAADHLALYGRLIESRP